MSWILRDYRCDGCGHEDEILLRLSDPVPQCTECGDRVTALLSPVRGRVKLGEVSRGKNGTPPPNALDTRPLADGMSYSEWRERQRSKRRDEIHRMAKEM